MSISEFIVTLIVAIVFLMIGIPLIEAGAPIWLMVLLALGLLFLGFYLRQKYIRKKDSEKEIAYKQEQEEKNEREKAALSPLCQKAGVSVTSEMSAYETRKALHSAATEKFRNELEQFCVPLELNVDGFKYLPVDSSGKSTLGICNVSKTTFYYNIRFRDDFCSTAHYGREYDFAGCFWQYCFYKADVESDNVDKQLELMNTLPLVGRSLSDMDNIYRRWNEDICTHTLPQLEFSSIPLSDIKYFKTGGDISYSSETNISGGGVNAKGAVAGGILLGGVGAIVGSRIGTEIKSNSETIRHDDRTLSIAFSENGTVKTLVYEGEAAEYAQRIFNEIIPQKEFSYIVAHQGAAAQNTNQYLDELERLKQLLDTGVITQEDFDKKKAQLLDL